MPSVLTKISEEIFPGNLYHKFPEIITSGEIFLNFWEFQSKLGIIRLLSASSVKCDVDGNLSLIG